MILLVGGATTAVRRLQGDPHLGILTMPGAGNAIYTIQSMNMPWAADNGAFSKFDEPQYVRMLDKMAGTKPLFVVAPDVVGDAEATLGLYAHWEPILKERGFQRAFVAQDNIERIEVPWDRIDCLFLGGTTAFKLSEETRLLVKQAKSLGKWVHMGRVNSRKRVMLARAWGCDSFDGSSFSRWGNVWIPKALEWLKEPIPGEQVDAGGKT